MRGIGAARSSIRIPALVLSGLSAPHAAAEALPAIEPLTNCYLEVPAELGLENGADCGYAVVPQARGESGDTGRIRLAFMRLNADVETDAAPLVMLAGGPGRALTGDPAVLQLFQSAFLGPVLETRDVVLMEQRGTLRARPHLGCPGFWSAWRDTVERALDEDAGRALLRERVGACVALHAAAGVDLAAWTNIENAADVNDLRAALGYERIVLYGASYGTELGQHVMCDFPEVLEAVVLDGAGALSVTNWSSGQARNAQWGIDNLTRLCIEDAECAATYDIPALLDAALSLFDEGPIATTFEAPNDPATRFDLEITAEVFAGHLHELQTSKDGVMAFPALLTAYLAEGRPRIGADVAAQAGAQLLADPEALDAGTAILMHFAMICSDDPPRSLDELETAGFGRYEVLFARNAAALYVEMCDLLDLPELPARFDLPVTTDVPVLVLSGGLDVQTPTFVSQSVVDQLPNATHFVFPAGFHVQVTSVNECAIRIAREFIADPSAPPGLSCVTQARPLSFLGPDLARSDSTTLDP